MNKTTHPIDIYKRTFSEAVNKELQDALNEVIKAQAKIIDDMTREQFIETIRQLVASGDLRRTLAPHGQRLDYVPYRAVCALANERDEALKEVERLEKELEETRIQRDQYLHERRAILREVEVLYTKALRAVKILP